jgi:hypothetical protein
LSSFVKFAAGKASADLRIAPFGDEEVGAGEDAVFPVVLVALGLGIPLVHCSEVPSERLRLEVFLVPGLAEFGSDEHDDDCAQLKVLEVSLLGEELEDQLEAVSALQFGAPEELEYPLSELVGGLRIGKGRHGRKLKVIVLSENWFGKLNQRRPYNSELALAKHLS